VTILTGVDVAVDDALREIVGGERSLETGIPGVYLGEVQGTTASAPRRFGLESEASDLSA